MEHITQETLEAMQNVDVRTVDPATLRDIRDGSEEFQSRYREYTRRYALP